MNREDQIRKEILFQAYTLRPLALSPERIARDARKSGYDFTETEVRREAVFLCDESLIFKIEQPGTTAILYRIHNNGVRHYEQNFAA